MSLGIYKDYLPGKENPEITHKPLRTLSTPNTFTKSFAELCSRFAGEGNIVFDSTADIQSYKGIYSFTMYNRKSPENFLNSHYYHGLFLYAEMLYSHPFFKDVAMVLYTDEATYPLLKQIFSSYPKVIYAITHVRKYEIKDTIEDTVLRCIRFHALEAFPKAFVCTRDADTLFASEIMNTNQAYEKGYKGTTPEGVLIDDYRPFLAQKLGDWEAEFLTTWFTEGSPINIGTNLDYVKKWHKELPLIYPIKNVTTKYSTAVINRRKKLLDSEKGGRFKNYAEKMGQHFFMSAPLGVLAGFTNFLMTRPDDLWLSAFNYISSHYELVSTEHGIMISDYNVEFVHQIGKDERMILFAIIPKYYTLCYFFSIEMALFNVWAYKPPESIINTFSKASILLDFGIIKDMPLSGDESHIKIYTVLFSPNYIQDVYKIEINPSEVESWDYEAITNDQARLKLRLMKFNKQYGPFTTGPLHVYFKLMFAQFSEKYKEWISTFLKIPNEIMMPMLQEIIHMKRIEGYNDNYVELNNTNFYKPIEPIHPRLRKTRTNRRNQKMRTRRRRS
jgi:hypothetical protein